MHRDRLDFVVQLQEDPQKERFQKMKLVKSEQPGQNEREEIWGVATTQAICKKKIES